MRPVIFILYDNLLTPFLLHEYAALCDRNGGKRNCTGNAQRHDHAASVRRAEGILHVGGSGELVLHTAESGGGSVNTNQLKEKELVRIAATGSVLSVEDKGTGILKE